MEKFKVLITGAINDSGVESLKKEEDLDINFRPDIPFSEILEIIGDYHCIITRSETPITKELIDRAPNLKVVARAAVGVANIDVDYATEKGILVMNTPGKNTNSAAEMTMALLLALVRKVTPAHSTMNAGGWDRHRFTGMELTGKTIGIVGLGNVGHRMARFSLGFDMRVLAYDPYIPDEVFQRHRVEKCDFETLLKECDIISIHTPKNKETTGMFAAGEIAKMKPGVVIVNAARGGIIEEKALKDALKSGHVAGAGIDTWDGEPPEVNLFRDMENVVMTPHIGASTIEAQIRIAETIAVQVPRALRGGLVDYPVNMPQIRMLEGNLMVSYTVLVEKLGSFAAQFVDFKPEKLEIIYRGDIAAHDCTLLRLAFLKGYLNHSMEYVSYVNAEMRANQDGLKVVDREDPGFTDYESAVKFVFSANDHEFSIGGVVFSGPHPRITLVDGFTYEVQPKGTFLAIRTQDRLGVVSHIADILDRHKITISKFDFSHHDEWKRSMFLIRVGKNITEEVLEELSSLEYITLVRRINV